MKCKCNKCGWSGDERETVAAGNGEFKGGCPVCRYEYGRYCPTTQIIPQQPDPALEVNNEWGVMAK